MTTLNKDILYPFVVISRNGAAEAPKYEPTWLEKAVLSARVENAEEGYLYRVGYFANSAHPVDTTKHSWSIQRTKGPTVTAEVITTSPQIPLTPDTGVQIIRIPCSKTGEVIVLSVDTTGIPGTIYNELTGTSASYHHYIDPMLYVLATPKEYGRMYPFSTLVRTAETTASPRYVADWFEERVVGAKVRNAVKGFYYRISYYGIAAGGWILSRFEGIDGPNQSISRADTMIKEIPVDQGIVNLELTASTGEVFELAFDTNGFVPKNYSMSTTSATNFHVILDPSTYEYVNRELDLFVEYAKRLINSKPPIFTPNSDRWYAAIIGENGKVRNELRILANNQDLSSTPASLTKMMTALVTMQYVNYLYDTITVTDSDIRTGSGNNLLAGDIITYHDALVNLMLPSSNTSAELLARNVGDRITTGGGRAAFINEMNKMAARLGMNNTTFLNPHGLVEVGHISTPKDIAILAVRYSQNTKLNDIWKMASFEFYVNGPNSRTINVDHSLPLVIDQSIDGAKTGTAGTISNIAAVIRLPYGYKAVVAILNSDGPDNRLKDLHEAITNLYGRMFYAPKRGGIYIKED